MSRIPRNIPARLLAAAFVLAMGPGAPAQIADVGPKAIEGEGVTDSRGAQLPLETPLMDSDGRAVMLGDYFDGRRPVLFALVYYDCPMLCNMTLADMNLAIREQGLRLGKDYRVVCLSFDHTNTIAQAAGKKAAFTKNIEGAGENWTFLLATEQNAKLVSDAVGFSYRFQPRSGEFAHEMAMYVLTPSGEVSNVMTGRYPAQFDEKQMRLSLGEAADGKIGSLLDRVQFWCYHFDPAEGTFTVQAMRIMQLGASSVAVGLFGVIGGLFLTSKRRRGGSGGAPATRPVHTTTHGAPDGTGVATDQIG